MNGRPPPKPAVADREATHMRYEGLGQLLRSLLEMTPLEEKLQHVTDTVVRLFDADFCRIWLIRPGDRCERGCMHAEAQEGPHICRNRDRCLHLVASSGRYTHIDGGTHRRVPFGCYKIGCIASGEERGFLTNFVQHEPRVHDRAWARDLGLVSFAGYRLRAPEGETLGVLALFSKHPILEDEDAILDGLGSTVALVIQRTVVEKALHDSETKFRTLYDSTSDAVLLLNQWGFFDCNPAALAIFGCATREDVCSKHPASFSPPLQPDGTDSMTRANQHIATAMKNGHHHFEWMHRRLDTGKSFPAEILLSAMELDGKLALQAVVRDITERKLVEDTRDEALSRIQKIASLVPGLVFQFRLHPDGKTCMPFASDVINEIFRVSPEQVREDASAIFANIHPDDSARTTASLLTSARRLSPWKHEFRVKFDDGTIRDLYGNAVPQREKDGSVLWHGIITDINEHKQAEELRLTCADLERSNKELEQFAYVASHDLQEPLRMVSSFTQLLARRYEGQLDAEAHEFIAFAVDGANRMQSLINDLLAYSRVGTRSEKYEPVDYASVLEQALANLKTAIEASGATVTHDPLPVAMADMSQMVNLFQNLIGNAVKFHAEKPPRVHLSAVQKGKEWVFSIRDEGIGIDLKYSERIFQIFQRLHTIEEYPGTGIGLAICKKIVERHGGRIWVESQLAKGSTFYFTVPVEGAKL